MRPLFIHQIYYDEASYNKVLPGFIPLDNTANQRPDWFELWVIMNYLQTNTLNEDGLYGFLSPKFQDKTGFHSEFIIPTLNKLGDDFEVAIFSSAWDQVCYFLNPWEQGEVWHSGLTQASQDFLDFAKIDVDLRKIVTDSNTSVYSNYLIGNKRFWLTWLEWAQQCFTYFETIAPQKEGYQHDTAYGMAHNRYPMKTFIQERLASLVLATGDFITVSADRSSEAPIFNRLFSDTLKNRRLLQACDLMKQLYRKTNKSDYLNMYWQLRQEVAYTPPRMN